MRTIYKYEILNAYTEVEIPNINKVVMVDMQGNFPKVWAEVETENGINKRYAFFKVETGMPIPPGTTHAGSYQLGPFVWHIYWKQI